MPRAYSKGHSNTRHVPKETVGELGGSPPPANVTDVTDLATRQREREHERENTTKAGAEEALGQGAGAKERLGERLGERH